MAQLLKPVCTDPFKLQNPLPGLSGCSRRGRWSVLPTRRQQWVLTADRGGGQGWNEWCKVKAVVDDSIRLEAGLADDYYAVLGLVIFIIMPLMKKVTFLQTPDATQEEIKKAYYNCMKACHPDLSGDDPESTDFCKFINEVYEVLSDPVQRRVYDEIHGYSLTAINPFSDDSSPKDHVFVDEFSCIGCKNCANVAPDVFKIEEDFGRARVYKQCGKGNTDRVKQAVESCPVDCIHWTSASQLSLLEDEMRRVERVNVGLMLAGMGASADVFRMASSRWEKRQSKLLERAKLRMMKQNSSNNSDLYWSDFWGKQQDHQDTGNVTYWLFTSIVGFLVKITKEKATHSMAKVISLWSQLVEDVDNFVLDMVAEEVKERARRAASAARRWREYSRRCADKPRTYKLPQAMDVSNKD
ncbi:hypothetical protein Cgig2_021118 [Carnegiea gigantea]|uniref:Uncharacterized protein n=1 Tax=Carnegiea gigantea TaxID=171969 RepID=A0A9Q1JWT5_9CARY|nr:hypothetical protein Cgig2_021118 [Carnegiea gigantea]